MIVTWLHESFKMRRYRRNYPSIIFTFMSVLKDGCCLSTTPSLSISGYDAASIYSFESL